MAFQSQAEKLTKVRNEHELDKGKSMKNALLVLGGAIIGFLCASALVAGALFTGYLGFNPSPAMVTTQATAAPTEITAPTLEKPTWTPSATFTTIPTLTSTPEPGATSTLTGTPVTDTPVSPCMKHSKGVYIQISMDENGFVFRSSDICLMMSSGGGSVGQPVIGTLVNEKITILQREFSQYYEFKVAFNADRTASKGVYVEQDLTFFEFTENGFGWAEEDYKPGQYWFLMKFVKSPTSTPTP